MIDTDKYEGHSLNVNPGNIQSYGHFNDEGKRDATIFFIPDNNSEDFPSVTETNVHLLADAPLLLAEVKRLEALIRSKGLCTNCGQSHEGIEVVMDYSEDEVGHRISKECVGTCHPNLSVHCCDLCLCLNGFTIEHDYWEAKKNE